MQIRDDGVGIAPEILERGGSYTGLKYPSDNKKPLLETHGTGERDRFFTQLAIIGLMPGETCEIFQYLYSITWLFSIGYKVASENEPYLRSQKRNIINN